MLTMVRAKHSSLVLAGIMAIVVASALVPIVAQFAGGGPGTTTSVGATFQWEPILVALHLITDLLIGLSYVAISATLIHLARKAGRDIPFLWAFVAFGVFIISCGMTHFIAAITLWAPLYWIAGSVKYVTALASVGTAVAVPPLVPQIMTLIHDAKLSNQRRLQLETTNDELEALTARLTEMDELKTQFFARVSHELRTPLALILGPLENLRAATDLSLEHQHDLEIMQRNARLLLRHVNDLLDIARLDAGRMELHAAAVDLAQVVRLSAAHFEVLAHERHVAFTVETPPAVPTQADPEKVQRIVFNILANAFKFTPAGGTVRLTLRLGAERVVIEVADSGPGVAPALRDAIFEPFRQGDGGTTRRFGGTGLGLTIVKEFVALHGGTVTAGEAPEGGALFSVSVPWSPSRAGAAVSPVGETGAMAELARQALAELQPRATPAAAAHPEPDSGQPLVLVVEDNADMRHFIVQALAATYRIATASDGQEGLDKARALRPDLIVSDLMMPYMSGEDFVRAVRAQPNLDGVPIVLATARADEELRARLLRDGAQDYLVKPFATAELCARVGNLITLKRTRDVLQQELASQHLDLENLAHEATARNRELQAALAALQESETRFRRLVESNIIGVNLADVSGAITDANDAFLQIVGYTRQDVRAGVVRWDTMTPPEYRHLDAQALAALHASGVCAPWEKEFIRKDGRRVPVLLGVALLEGTQETCIAFVLDLTERKQAEAAEQLARQRAEQALQVRDQFLSHAAHELKTPLTSILGNLQLAESRVQHIVSAPDGDPKSVTAALAVVQDLYRRADAQLERLTRLVNDLLDVSRIEEHKLALRLEWCDLAALVRTAVEEQPGGAATRTIHLDVSDGVVVPVIADADRLRQVVLNYLSNALKYAPIERPITVGLRVEGVLARVWVHDEGPGIPLAAQAHVWERSYQVAGIKPQSGSRIGLGLGLYICRTIVEQHQGQVGVESTEGQGSTFWFTVLLDRPEATSAKAAVERTSA